MSDTKKTYPLTLAPLYQSGKFALNSITIGEEQIELLGKVTLGGRLVVKYIKEESRKSERSPVAYLEYLTPAEVAEAANAYKARKLAEQSQEGI